MTLTSRSVAGREGVRMLALVAGSVLTVVGAAAPAPTAAGDTPPTGDLSLTEVGRMREPRAGAAAVRLADGRVLVIGGTSGAQTEEGDSRIVLDSAEVFDPVSGTWTDAGTMSEPRAYAAAAALPDGRVLVTGGRPLPTHAHDPMGSSTSENLGPRDGRLQPVWLDASGTLGSHSDHVVRRSRAGRRRHRAGRGGKRPRPVRGQDDPWRSGGGRFAAVRRSLDGWVLQHGGLYDRHARGPRGGPAAG